MRSSTWRWPTGEIADTAKAATAAAPWTKVVAEFTSWQLKNLQQLTAPWMAPLP